jgi:phosphopantothenoylcysteine synthetase/decarboxylase
LFRLSWNRKGDPVLHIELRRWADILLVAPASANTIAKAANGICDNLLLCVIRAWDRTRPAIICPAMNTVMLDHPIISNHFSQLKSYGFTILDTDVKNLACGEVGKGALAPVRAIVEACRVAVSSLGQDLNRVKEKAAANEIISLILQPSRDATSGGPSRNDHHVRRCVVVIAGAAAVFCLSYFFGLQFDSVTKTKSIQ